ncbi:MAG TPA: SDR family oxidoreductase [Gemmataceae bacterium]|nr:SDR family oxidoreductase [Gemmataceae bacterium]
MPQRIRELFALAGKVAVVTGASKGIGEAIARGLAEFGAKVVVSSRKQEAVEAVAAALRQDGLEAAAVAAHVGDPGAVARLVEKTVALFGGIDVVVNNAAVNPVYAPLLEVDAGALDKIMAVNVRGPLELARRAHPLMKARGGGSVVNVSSVAGIAPIPNLGLYGASKAALINLTKAMAREWGRDGIRANVICPGLIRTKFSAALWQDEKVLEGFLRRLPLGRIGEPEDVAGLAVFLAAPASQFCTGAVFTADGGETI